MSISSSVRLMATVGAAAALAVAAPAAAGAMGAHPAQLAAARHHHHHAHFVARGVVVKHSAHHVTVFARTLHRGASVRHNARVQVRIPARHAAHGAAVRHHLRRLHSGDRIVARGMVTGRGKDARLTLTHVEDHAAPFDVFVGTITNVYGSIVTVSRFEDSGHDSIRPDDHGDDGDRVSIDVGDAAVTVDGSAGTLAVGQTVVALGSYVDGDVVATSVFAFTSSPDVAAGEVQSIDGSVVMLCEDHGGPGPGRVGDDHANPMDNGHDCDGDDGHGHDDGGRGNGDGDVTTVDLTGAQLIVNGDSGATSDQITLGSELVAVGTTDDAGTLDATLAVDFTRDCDSRHHGDGGDDDGPGHH